MTGIIWVSVLLCCPFVGISYILKEKVVLFLLLSLMVKA